MSHELCHIFGLKHCYYFDCAMNESASIAEAATQPLFLCPVCLRKMHKAVFFNPLERYREMLQVIKQLRSAVLKSSPRIEKDTKDTAIESEGDKVVSTTVQVSVEVVNNLEADDTEIQVEPSDQIDHNIVDSKNSDRRSNAIKELVDKDYIDSSNSERFEEAIVWLERVVSSLAQFEDQWLEQRDGGHHAKNKVV